MNTSVILPAAGLGSRFAAGGRASASKIEFELQHKPVFLHAIELFHGRSDVGQILLAVHPDRLDEFALRWADKLAFLGGKLIAGGRAERWETVKLALDQVSPGATHIAVHDAARPCASPRMIDRVFEAACRFGAVVPGLAMSDTIKRAEPADLSVAPADPLDAIFDAPSSVVADMQQITGTIPRSGLYRVQTPQVFERALMIEAYARLNADNAAGITDDASVIERAGHTVYLVEGDPLNLKLTHADDAELLEAVMKLRGEKGAKAAAKRALFGDEED